MSHQSGSHGTTGDTVAIMVAIIFLVTVGILFAVGINRAEKDEMTCEAKCAPHVAEVSTADHCTCDMTKEIRQ